MVRLSELIALSVSILCVQATLPNLGWTGGINIGQTSVYSDDGELIVNVPLTLRRVGSTATELLVEVFATPYRVTNSSLAGADGIPTIKVASESVRVQPGTNEVSHPISFRISIEWRDYYISARITPQGESLTTQNQAGDVILANTENGDWIAVDTGVYQHEINLGIIREINETVIGEDDPEEEQPPVGRTDPEIQPPKAKENGPQGNVTSPGGGSTPTGPGGRPTYPGGNDGDGGGGQGTLITSTRTTTICPPPSPPPPPPCPENKRELVERLVSGPGTGTITPAYITGNFFYRDPNNAAVPIVAQRILLIANLYQGSTRIGGWRSWSTTGVGGYTSFKFSIREGQRIEVVKIRARMSSYSDYVIGTRTDSTQDFTVSWAESNLAVSDIMKVDAGKTAGYPQNVFPKSPANDGLRLSDSLHTVAEYAKNNVLVPGEGKIIHVWFPSINKDPDGTLSTAYFQAYDGKIVYINLPQQYAEWPGTIAHEYGHFMHSLAISPAVIPGGGDHSICDNKTYGVGLTFSEGYASSFAMQALDTTHLETEYMVFKQGPTDYGFHFEVFDCTPIGLRGDEGRITAAILELVDRKLDELPTSSSNIGNVDTPFDASLLNARFDQRLIFWEIMKRNPRNMVEYWQVSHSLDRYHGNAQF